MKYFSESPKANIISGFTCGSLIASTAYYASNGFMFNAVFTGLIAAANLYLRFVDN